MKKEKIKRMIKMITAAVLMVVAVTTISSAVYADEVFEDISGNIVRLHVIANSDTDADQKLKLKVRDAIVEYTSQSLKDCNTSEDVIASLKKDSENIKVVAENCLRDEGSSYSAYVTVGDFDFPAKNYGEYCFPQGEYQALRVVIGDGVGQNWWCVLFPPLCYISENAVSVDSKAESDLKENLSSEAFDTIKGDSDDANSNKKPIISDKSGISSSVKVTYKFKIVEFFQKVFSFFTN